MSVSAEHALPRLHVVTDDDVLAQPDFVATAAAVLEAGGARVALHVRGRATSGSRTYALAHELRSVAARTRTRLIVNDRVDVALAVGADGVQLGSRGMPVPDARTLLGSALIGYSAHGTEEALSAIANGADYVFAGTIWQTPSHPDVAGAGLELIRVTCTATTAPVIGIGGVTPRRAAELRASGAYGAAVVSGVWHAASPADAVAEYLSTVASGAGDQAERE